MTIQIDIVSILLWIYVFVSAFVIKNLYSDKKAYQSIIESWENYRTLLLMRFADSIKRLKDIDIRGSFESDDEIGWTFKFINEEFKLLNSDIATYFQTNSEKINEKTETDRLKNSSK